MITSVTWVPKGASRSRPVRFELSKEEYQRIKNLARYLSNSLMNLFFSYRIEAGDSIEGNSNRSADEDLEFNGESDDLPSNLRMDTYDDEDSVPDFQAIEDFDDEDELEVKYTLITT